MVSRPHHSIGKRLLGCSAIRLEAHLDLSTPRGIRQQECSSPRGAQTCRCIICSVQNALRNLYKHGIDFHHEAALRGSRCACAPQLQ
jgi:hypothetical protein